MTHELKKIVQAYQQAKEKGIAAVLASVVALEGSSYRRPGVRMLILADGRMIGAVSGGCVEKEIQRQAESVFATANPRMMTYDGRYRLGCEGIISILIEPFDPGEDFIEAFWVAVAQRTPINSRSFYSRDDNSNDGIGTQYNLSGQWWDVRPGYRSESKLEKFQQSMEPCLRLVIIGAEHDAVQLSSFAAMAGWEVTVVASPSEEKVKSDFPGALSFHNVQAEEWDISKIDDQTAVMLMTHSYVKDLSFLIRLMHSNPLYLGILGPGARRERLLNEFLERNPEASLEFVESIRGPAGLDLGAETPQEIAIAIISEILTVHRQTSPEPLRDKTGAIHRS